MGWVDPAANVRELASSAPIIVTESGKDFTFFEGQMHTRVTLYPGIATFGTPVIKAVVEVTNNSSMKITGIEAVAVNTLVFAMRVRRVKTITRDGTIRGPTEIPPRGGLGRWEVEWWPQLFYGELHPTLSDYMGCVTSKNHIRFCLHVDSMFASDERIVLPITLLPEVRPFSLPLNPWPLEPPMRTGGVVSRRPRSEEIHCTRCFKMFRFFRPRHHCRLCGSSFCKKCMEETVVQHLGKKEEPVCLDCLPKISNLEFVASKLSLQPVL
jgi:hypothetical protein